MLSCYLWSQVCINNTLTCCRQLIVLKSLVYVLMKLLLFYEESSHVIAINMLMFTSLSPGIECNSSVMPYKLNHRLADHIE